MKIARILGGLLSAAMLVAGSGSAWSAQLIYGWVGNVGPQGWSSTGWFEVTESDVVPFQDLLPYIDSWQFSWTNGVDSFSISGFGSTGKLHGSFTVRADFSVLNGSICTGTCNTQEFPEFFGESGFGNWDATIAPNVSIQGLGDYSFDGTRPGDPLPPHTALPSPATLVLLCIGLPMLAARRGYAARH